MILRTINHLFGDTMGARVQVGSPCRDNAVIQRLKNGKGNVAGIKMLVAVDGLALVPVEVAGLDFYSRHCSNGVSVKITPIGGHGHIWVAPGDLIDNTAKAIAYHQKKCTAHDRVRKIRDSRSDRERRTQLLNIRSEMTAEQKKRFDDSLADRLGDKASKDAVAAINRMSGEYEFNRIAEYAVVMLYDLDGDDDM